jgi:deoxyxylulose-5-phosphate synthase
VVAACADALDLRAGLQFAVNSKEPVCLRYPKNPLPEPQEACSAPFEIGRSLQFSPVANADAAIVCYGPVLAPAFEAAGMLRDEGIEAAVVNARFAAPLDGRIVELAASGTPVVTVEDHGLCCGFGSALLEAVAGFGGSGRVGMVGAKRAFIPCASRDVQLAAIGISAEGIAMKVRETAARSPASGIIGDQG